MQMSQPMHSFGSTTCVRCPVEKKLIASVGHARRHKLQLMQRDRSILTTVGWFIAILSLSKGAILSLPALSVVEASKDSA